MSDLKNLIEKPSFQTIKLLSGKALDIRGWLMKEEKDFLFAVETRMDDKSLLIDESIKLAERCVDDKHIETFRKLSRNDLVYALAQMRKLSKGNTVDFSYRCSNEECDDYMVYNEEQKKMTGLPGQGRTLLESKINIDEDVNTKEYSDDVIELENCKIHVKEVSYKNQRTLEKKYIKEDNPSLNGFNYAFVLNSIKAIEVPGKKTDKEPSNVIDDFTQEELIEFVDGLKPPEFQKITDGVSERVSEFNINKKVSCPLCKIESEIVYDEIFSMMVFS